MYKILLLSGVLFVTSAHGGDVRDVSHGFQILTKMARQYLKAQPEDLTLGEGVHIVSTTTLNDADARSMPDDGSFLGTVDNYLQSHELRIKLPELMPGEGFGRAFKDAMTGFDGNETGKMKHQIN